MALVRYGTTFDITEPDNGNVHRAAANIMQAGKAARPAAPCATYCYTAFPFDLQENGISYYLQ